jgi:hypothetical protein
MDDGGKWCFKLDNMKLKSLQRITKSLRNVFAELKRCDLQDSDFRPKYAEYLTALKLAEKGHAVQLLDEREKTSADIYLPNTETRVEVKSAVFDEYGLTYASFGIGTQIKKRSLIIVSL